MRKNIKIFILAALATCATNVVQADPCSIFDVTVPNQQGGFTAAANALYLRGTSSNLGYSLATGITYVPNFPDFNAVNLQVSGKSIDTTYQWGFDATLGYRFPNSGNDLTATWTHLGDFRNTDQNTVINERMAVQVPPVSYFTQAGSANFDYNGVDLDLGQKVNFGDYFTFRMFAGGRWTDIDETLTKNYNLTAIADIDTPTNIVSTYEDSDFKGIGPQVGFNGRACLGYGFGIDVSLIGSLLVGSSDTNADINTFDFLGNTIIDSSVSHLSSNNLDHVVPALDANAGLDYTFAFANPDRSYVSIQGGYKTINYFNVAQNTIIRTADPTLLQFNDIATTYTPNKEESNVAFNGAYLGVTANL